MGFRKLVVTLKLRSQLQNVIRTRYYCSKGSNILETAEEVPLYLEQEDGPSLREKRNKSRLNPEHRNMLNGQRPYDEPVAWFHETVRYKRRTLGRYGMQALDAPAGLAWPTPEEVEHAKEYEKVAFPLGLQERLKNIKEKKKKDEEALIARQKEIDVKMSNMQELIKQVQAKIAKKQADQEEARLRKERKIEEIRQQLINQGGLTKDNLELALSKAEKEEKKKKKESKKLKLLERQERLIKEATEQSVTQNNPDDNEDDDAANEKKE